MADLITQICLYRDCMKELKKHSMRTNVESPAAGGSTGSGTSMMHDALCDAVLKDCQRKLKESEIPQSMTDPEELRSRMMAKARIYDRMVELYAIKKDKDMESMYRFIKDAIRSAIAYYELTEQTKAAKQAKPAKQSNPVKQSNSVKQPKLTQQSNHAKQPKLPKQPNYAKRPSLKSLPSMRRSMAEPITLRIQGGEATTNECQDAVQQKLRCDKGR